MKITFTYSSPSGLKYAAVYDTMTRRIHTKGHGQQSDVPFQNAQEALQKQATAARIDFQRMRAGQFNPLAILQG